jgi:hypothetical protein
MSISKVAKPAAFSAAAWKPPRGSTPSEPWQINTAGAGSASTGVASLPAMVSGGSASLAKAA